MKNISTGSLSENGKTRLAQHMYELFSFVPPEKLNSSVYKIFFSHLMGHGNFDDLNELATDIYFLLNILEKAEKELQ